MGLYGRAIAIADELLKTSKLIVFTKIKRENTKHTRLKGGFETGKKYLC
jgi:hypothetical protein